jgi:hypothetical protein
VLDQKAPSATLLATMTKHLSHALCVRRTFVRASVRHDSTACWMQYVIRTQTVMIAP